MSRNRCPEGQHHLFPPDVCPPATARAVVPLPPLPFELEKTIDVARACSILGTNRNTVVRMVKRKLISGYPIDHSRSRGTKHYRIEYDSLLSYCDNLRRKYHLPPRPPRTPGVRPRDSEVLPFPIADTIGIAEVAEYLDVSRISAIKLIDTGEIQGYQLFGGKTSDWRVRRSSFARYLEGLRIEAQKPVSEPCTI